MKKIPFLLSALSFAFILSCGTKKQPGEEYYDADYKPQMSNSSASSEIEAPVPGDLGQTPATDGTQTSTDSATAQVSTSTTGAAGTTTTTKKPVTTDPAKDEASVNVVAKDKLKDSPAGADFTKGKNLIAKSDCLACHKDDVKLLGPAYVDVAKKYEPTEANINKLVSKIIKGGSGVWGEIPMSPHPDLPQNDAKEMVKYILSLK